MAAKKAVTKKAKKPITVAEAVNTAFVALGGGAEDNDTDIAIYDRIASECRQRSAVIEDNMEEEEDDDPWEDDDDYDD